MDRNNIDNFIASVCDKLEGMPTGAQYAFAFGVLGSSVGDRTAEELKKLYKALSDKIDQIRA